MGYHSLMKTTHPSNVNLPSSGQQSTAWLSARKVFVARGIRAQDAIVRDPTIRRADHVSCLCSFAWQQRKILVMHPLSPSPNGRSRFLNSKQLQMKWRDWWIFYAPVQNYRVISEREYTGVVGLSQILFNVFL